VSISQLGLGTAPLGGLYTSLDETDVASAIYAALDAGITYIDTAPHYGKGTAERRLGRYFAGFPRASFTLSTKVGRLLVPASNLPDNDFVDADQSVERVFDFSAAGVERSLEESLVRLGLDQVEIVFIHDPDDHADQAISQAYPALERMRSQGMIKSIGVGMNQSAIPTRFIKETDIDIVLIAGRYSLLDQSAAADLLPAALARGVDVIAAGVFNSGILANPGEGAMYNYSPADAEILRRAQVMKALLADFGIPITQAALQFPLRHPAVKAVLVGCRSGHEVRSNIESFNQEIPEDAWSALAELHLEIV
jgi:D-threo-aldose 1-dehydrogenase